MTMQKPQTVKERRRAKRRPFAYYMQIVDAETQEPIGHLSDISTLGFKIDSQNEIPIGKEFRMRLDLNSDVADIPYMTFTARSKWCRNDELYPFMYNVGFELLSINPHEAAIYARIVEKYGTPESRW
ncbi:MAG: PilZ domain-containing protein [Candidatus Villigracilaceae bacterium]